MTNIMSLPTKFMIATKHPTINASSEKIKTPSPPTIVVGRMAVIMLAGRDFNISFHSILSTVFTNDFSISFNSSSSLGESTTSGTSYIASYKR